MPYRIDGYICVEQEKPAIHNNLKNAISELEQLSLMQPENHYELIEFHEDPDTHETEEVLVAWAPAEDSINLLG